MNVGLYIADIKPSDGGIYQHSILILKMLLGCDSIKQLTLFISAAQVNDISPLIAKKPVKLEIFDTDRLNSLTQRFSRFWLNRYYFREKPAPVFLKLHKLLNRSRSFFNKFNLDVLHVPKQHSPVYGLNYPVVITMHDVQQLIFPHFFTALQRIQRAISYHISIQEADGIIVSYKHVKDDLVKYFSDAGDKVSVCDVPVNNDWMLSEETPNEILIKKYDLPENFILTPAATWEHKNHFAVLEAINILRNQNLKVHWIATGLKTPFYGAIEKKILDLDLNEQIKFTGLVSDSDLRGLYSLARLVVIPTKYEAGSTPLFEAMRYGVPVICSNITSLPDTISDHDFIFDPDDYVRLAELIKKGLTDDNFIARNKDNSRNRMEEYTQKDYCTAFINAYRSAMDRHALKLKNLLQHH